MKKLTRVVSISALVLSIQAHADVIDFPPKGNNFQNVAANVPAQGNVWIGVAQSFTAQDPRDLIGFYVGNFTGAPIKDQLLLSLYAGDGVFTQLLDQASTTVSLQNFATELSQADFSAIALVPGDRYTIVATLPSQSLPASGTYADIGVLYNSNVSNVYPGGRFYFFGAAYDESLPEIADRTSAFKVTPVTATPEPSTLALLGIGLVGVAMARRRKMAVT